MSTDEHSFEALFDELFDPAVIVDSDGAILKANKPYLKMFGQASAAFFVPPSMTHGGGGSRNSPAPAIPRRGRRSCRGMSPSRGNER